MRPTLVQTLEAFVSEIEAEEHHRRTKDQGGLCVTHTNDFAGASITCLRRLRWWADAMLDAATAPKEETK